MTATRISSPREVLARISRKFAKTAPDPRRSSNEANGKQVRFAETASSSVHPQYVEPSYELTNELCEDVWWSADEHLENDLERRQLAREFRKRQGAVQLDHELATLYDGCCTLNVTQVLRYVTTKHALMDVFGKREGLRGLESRLSKTTSKRRKLHVCSVLSVCSFDASVDLANTDDCLTENWKQSSKASEIMARAIALVDEKEARR